MLLNFVLDYAIFNWFFDTKLTLKFVCSFENSKRLILDYKIRFCNVNIPDFFYITDTFIRFFQSYLNYETKLVKAQTSISHLWHVGKLSIKVCVET